jgi:hypothetical protein
MQKNPGNKFIEGPEQRILRIAMTFLSLGLFAWAFYSGLYSLITAFKLIGDEQSISAQIVYISAFKHKQFELIGTDGKRYIVLPTDLELKSHKVGEKIEIKFNPKNIEEAYLRNNRHIIWRDVFGLLFWIFMGTFLYFSLINKKTRRKFRRGAK